MYLYSFYECHRSIYKLYNISPQLWRRIVARYCCGGCSLCYWCGWYNTLCSSVLPVWVSLLQDSQVLCLWISVIRTPGSFFSLLLGGLLWFVVVGCVSSRELLALKHPFYMHFWVIQNWCVLMCSQLWNASRVEIVNSDFSHPWMTLSLRLS